MIGRIVGALAGRSMARNMPGGMGGMGGMALGAALPTLARRMGPMGMIAAAAGGYAVKRMMDKRRAQSMSTPVTSTGTGPYRSAPPMSSRNTRLP
jgi:hypothetical protein